PRGPGAPPSPPRRPPPPVPAGGTEKPPGRPAAEKRMGGRPRRSRPAGGGLPAVHRTAAENAHYRRAGGHRRPGQRPATGLAPPVHHPGRPQGTAAHPDREDHRRGRRDQRTGRRHHHLARRPPAPPPPPLDHLSYHPPPLPRVPKPAEAGQNTPQTADVLNAEGFRPPKRTSRFTGGQVRTLITQRGIRSQRKGRPAVLTSLAPGHWAVPGLAPELGMPTATTYNSIDRR